MKYKTNSRRKFIEKASYCIAGSFVAATIPGLTSCEKSFYKNFVVDIDACVGCTDCSEVCYYGAIDLPTPSVYSINKNECDKCGKCINYCDYDAINVAHNSYEFVSDNCIRCGECIYVCRTLEEDAIVFTETPFEIIDYNNDDTDPEGCDPTQCGHECFTACRFDAITIGGKSDIIAGDNSQFQKGDQVMIDESKCTKCGDCVMRCPFDAIIPEAVSRDIKKCDNCGLCYTSCKVNNQLIKDASDKGEDPDESLFAITQTLPKTDFDSEIDQDKCTSCGRCYPACQSRLKRTDHAQGNKARQAAIERELFYARIDQDKCTKCSKCMQACNYDAINEV